MTTNRPKTRSRETPTLTTGPTAPVPQPSRAPIRVYLQGSAAVLTALPPVPFINTARHAAVVVLSVREEEGVVISCNGVSHTVQAAAIAPRATWGMHPNGTHTVCVGVYMVDPRFATLRGFIDRPLKRLNRHDFSHLNTRIEAARSGVPDVDLGSRLIDDVLDVVLATSTPQHLDPRIHEIMRKLDVDISYPFSRLAADLNLSASRLSHLFSKELGLSLRSFMAWGRVMQAWEMVALKPEMSLTEIAHVMGYADSSHMARSFHAALGLTPTLMRDRKLFEIVGKPMPKGHRIPDALPRPSRPRGNTPPAD